MSATDTRPAVDERRRFEGAWETKRLGEVADIVGGGTPSTTQPAYWGGQVLWCTPTDLTANRRKYQTGTERTISALGLQSSAARRLPKGALLLCTRATIGEVRIADVPIATNQGFQSLVCRDDFESEFVYYKLLTLKGDLVSLGVGSTFLEVSRKNVAAIRTALPALPEQRAIAAALSDVDDLLQSLDRLIAKKRDVKQGAMQQLLTGTTRLPGFEGAWKPTIIGGEYELLRTSSNSRSDLSASGAAAYVHYGDIHTRWHNFLDFRCRAVPRIDPARVGRATELQDGDLLIADASEDMGGVGKAVEVVNLSGLAYSGLHTIACRPKSERIAHGFGGYICDMPPVRKHFRRVANGLKVYGLSRAALRETPLLLPCPSEQRAIAAVLSDMDAEIDALEARRDKVAAIKQGMMQELLTGRTRLPIPEEAIDA